MRWATFLLLFFDIDIIEWPLSLPLMKSRSLIRSFLVVCHLELSEAHLGMVPRIIIVSVEMAIVIVRLIGYFDYLQEHSAKFDLLATSQIIAVLLAICSGLNLFDD